MKRALAALRGAVQGGGLLYALLFGLGVASVLWNLAAVLLYPLLPRSSGQALGRHAISVSYRFFWRAAQALGMMRIDAGALESLRSEATGVVIAANHPSMLDALLIVACLPRSVCIMKAALMGNVFLGAGARLARYIRNDSARGMIRGAVKSLGEGAQLVVFPEGTRTVTPPLNAFLPGATLIAHLANAPVQTVIIETDSPYLRKGWPIWRMPPIPVTFTLRLGERFAPQADHAALSRRLEAYFRQELTR
jgi:1-acyl-sn-glycerol-3-phosphate acyltransferase